jgi:hypothetical protein
MKFREAVSRGVNSKGVKFYLADHPEDERLFNTGHQDIAYRHFLDWLGGLLSDEIGVLFNPNDPANRLYPRQKTLDEVLELLNGGGIKPEETELREAWPKIWTQDETIGWVYQYFTPKELRDQARKESGAPRNSYELAFRNQFFTPRYVVEFLTDNTLGRIWYEMRKGNTKLKDHCRYMVRRPTEIFLKEGERLPNDAAQGGSDLSQEELLNVPVHIPHRPKKDPRELKILDPACGSGHFLLYCFDLLLTIYEEAYADPDLGAALHQETECETLEGLRMQLPRLILANNLHGIDIDLRASQMAALALWLRCQRAYQDTGLKKDRPKITRSNFICAEPMPGEEQMLKDFVAQLEPKLLGQVVEVVFDKMKLAGEAGPLLKIEEEIRDTVASAKKQWVRETTQATDRKGQPLLFTQAALDQIAGGPAQSTLFDLSDITDDQFFERAEAEVIKALRQYAGKAQNGQRLQRRLFKDDAEQGFAFVDLCQMRYDVVLMNPPFGDLSKNSKEYIESVLPLSKGNILAHFLDRASTLVTTQGKVGAIVSRTCFFLTSLQEFRSSILSTSLHVDAFADLGSRVLDAMVETAAVIFRRDTPPSGEAVFFRHLTSFSKMEDLRSNIDCIARGQASHDLFLSDVRSFSQLAGTPYVYWITATIIRQLAAHPTLEPQGCEIRVGLQTGDDFRFLRLWYEVPEGTIAYVGRESGHNNTRTLCLNATKHGETWVWYSKIDAASPFAASIHLVVNWGWEGREIKAAHIERGDAISRYVRSESFYFKPGISYMLRSSRLVPYAVPRGGIPTAGRSQIYPHERRELWVLALTASNIASAVARFRGENFGQPKFQNSMVASIPYIDPSPELEAEVISRMTGIIREQKARFSTCETCIEFIAPTGAITSAAVPRLERKTLLGKQLDLHIAAVFGFSEADMSGLERDMLDSITSPSWVCEETSKDDSDDGDTDSNKDMTEDVHPIWSYNLGCIFGRWDIRFAKGERKSPELDDPFAPLPACSPGMLQGPPGVPAHATPESYPLRIDWEGILVDDADHTDDIVSRVRDALEVIWKDGADAIEKEACDILGVKELRDYFRKPGKGGFWDDHVSRYTKSRRKAPIYWLFQSTRKNYALWLYYHRLDKDLLFKALVNYVEPKIRLENSRLESIRKQKAAVGDSGKEAKRLATEGEQQEDFISELRDFEDKLRRAANLHLLPDLNDGVVLNIAPLWELVPWKEAKSYWEELLKGEYEWSSIGKQLRQKGLVK